MRAAPGSGQALRRPERGVSGRKIGIGEVTAQIRCARVPFEHVDAAGTEVGGVKIAVSTDRGFRGPLVNIRRGSDLQYFRSGSQGVSPAGDRTVFAHEEEGILIEGPGAGAGVEDLTGRGAGEGGGDSHDQRGDAGSVRIGIHVIESGKAGAVIGDPEGTRGTEGDPPGMPSGPA